MLTMRLETRTIRFKRSASVEKSLDNSSSGSSDNGKTVTVWMAPIGGKTFLPILSEGEPDPSSSSSLLRDSPTASSDRTGYTRNTGVTSPGSSTFRTSTASSSDGGVATFCDWSHGKCRGGDYVTRSTSALSPRTFPVMSADQSARRARLKQWRGESRGGGGGAHFHVRGSTTSGQSNSFADASRMFMRQKTGATKGEKEIMMGICQNRGDITSDTYANCPDCLMTSYGLISHRDAWSFGKLRQTPAGFFPPVSGGGKSKTPEIYHSGNSAKTPRTVAEQNQLFTRQQHHQQQQKHQQLQLLQTGNGNNEKTIDSCLICSRPKLIEQETPARASHSSMGKIPPPSTPVMDADIDNFLAETKQKLLGKSVAKTKRDKPKMKPKLLLNIHLPRVPQTSIRMSEENDMDYSEDKIRKHLAPQKQHLESR